VSHGYTRRVTGSSRPGAPAPFPARLGDFEIVGLLGEGGSGVVYSARWGHRDVALKVLHPLLVATPRERERFFSEAKLLAEITHPSVVKVLNVGALADPDGRPYLAMEKLEGETLGARLGRGPVAVAEALGIFSQLVGAVEALHARGLVHRDLKAENVMLVDGGRFAVLLDFGIAKEMDAPDSTVTQDGGIRGTPAYMAPERFFGQPASPHTDIYELGVVLYAMLAGCLPWTESNDADARLNPHRPSALGIQLPGTVETELLRALSTRPESRPASAREFLERVQIAADVNGEGGQRTTADMATAAPGDRVTATAGAPTVDPYAPTRDSGPRRAGLSPQVSPALQAPTAPGSPPVFDATTGQPTVPGSQIPPAQPLPPGGQFPGQPEQNYTTASARPARGRPVWPWLLVGLIVVGIAGGTALLLRSGEDDAAKSAEVGDEPAAAEAEAGWTSGAGETAGEPPAAPPGSEPSERALTSPPASERASAPDPRFAAAPKHHAADSMVVVGLRARALIESKPLGRVLLGQRENKELAPLLVIAQMCSVDLFSDVDWITFGIADFDAEEFDFIISGNLDREKIDACAANLASDPESFGWIDDRTFILTSRDKAGKSWIEARIAGKDSFADDPAKGKMLARVDLSSTLWFAGEPGKLLDGVDTSASKPTATFGGMRIGEDVEADVWVRYASKAEAEAAGKDLQKQLAEFPQSTIGKISVEIQGDELRFRAFVNSMVTEILASYLEKSITQTAE